LLLHIYIAFALFKHCGEMLQADLQRLEAQQAAQAEAHQLEMEAVQAQRAAEAQRMQDMFSFMASLQALPSVVVPQSLLAPVVTRPSPVGTPVSIYGCLFL
jgi:regulator of protease activity HflC (stomatin/prohibitin superfamily)